MVHNHFGGYQWLQSSTFSLECIDNNKASTILSCFLKGVNTYGMPSRVRSSQGRENLSVADFMIGDRGAGRGSMLTVKSTHNQRIECFWRNVFERALDVYYKIFSFMEDNAILDPFNEIDLAALHLYTLHQ